MKAGAVRGNLDYGLLRRQERQEQSRRAPHERSETDTGLRGGKRLLCSLCLFPITTSESRMEIQGSHVHTFANPHGYVYRIGCFLTAPGCLADHRETEEFTWFQGFAWSVEVCGRCLSHLGWRFRGAAGSFHGLVLDRLVEENQGPAPEA